MTDPLLKKCHPHRVEKYQPSVEEELEEWQRLEEERLHQQAEQAAWDDLWAEEQSGD